MSMAYVRIAQAGFLAGFAGLLALFFTFTAEDAWIVARYARNAVESGELVFNRGEFVNALTSPLDALLRIALHAITPDPMLAHKIAGIVLSLGTLAIGVTLLAGRRNAQIVFLALTALSAPFALWTVAGLETPLLALLVTGFAASLWRAAPRLSLGALLAGLAFLARHDSVLFTGPALVFAMSHRSLPRQVGTALLAAALPLAWLAFALVYFHDALPTSFHVKGPGVVRLTLGYNAVYLADFVLLSGVGLVVLLAFALAQGRVIVPPLGHLLRARAGLWIGLGLAVCLYGLLVATAHMMFSFRLFIPYLPVLALLAAELFAAAIDNLGATRRIVVAASGLISAVQITVAASVALWTLNPARLGEYQYVGAREYEEPFLAALSQAAAAIEADWRANAPTPPRPPRIATFAAGLLPWRLPDAYVFEALVSWRRDCPPDRRRLALLADYVHLMTPWFGTRAELLPGPADRWETVWERSEQFDGGTQSWMVVRNHQPDPASLPAYVDGACRLPDPQVSQTR